jgi:hypothetical protein
MKYNIKRGLKFGIPVFIVFTLFFSLAGLLPGLIIGSFVGGVTTLLISLVNSETVKETFADHAIDKERRTRKWSNLKQVLPNLTILLIGAILTRYTGKLYLMLILSVVLSTSAFCFQWIKSGKYKKAEAEGELVAFYALIITLPISQASIFITFLMLVYGYNVNEIFKLL